MLLVCWSVLHGFHIHTFYHNIRVRISRVLCCCYSEPWINHWISQTSIGVQASKHLIRLTRFLGPTHVEARATARIISRLQTYYCFFHSSQLATRNMTTRSYADSKLLFVVTEAPFIILLAYSASPCKLKVAMRQYVTVIRNNNYRETSSTLLKLWLI